jgi:hypothetical protein
MKYPDGSTIQVGDLIWWDEGYCVGYVQVIAESKDEYGSWGLDAPHIFVSNVHPFDPTIHTGVGYGESFLADDGIGLLTLEERVQLEQATSQALERVAADLAYSTYSVFTDVRDCKLVGWAFAFRKDDGTELKRITVPVKHESNA